MGVALFFPGGGLGGRQNLGGGGVGRNLGGGLKKFVPAASIVIDVFCWKVLQRHQIFPKKDFVLLSKPDYLS